ncbi:TPA: F-box protein, partial [Legionella pneumophila]
GAKNWDAIDKQWREGVGGAQKLLPMHVVYEYCSDKPFYPVPKFTSRPNSSKQFANLTTYKDENWFSVDSKLSVDFAIYMGMGGMATDGVCWCFTGVCAARRDLDAVTALCKVRTKDFIDLKSQLEERASLDNHYQTVPM